jgi:hypothetical protein
VLSLGSGPLQEDLWPLLSGLGQLSEKLCSLANSSEFLLSLLERSSNQGGSIIVAYRNTHTQTEEHVGQLSEIVGWIAFYRSGLHSLSQMPRILPGSQKHPQRPRFVCFNTMALQGL